MAAQTKPNLPTFPQSINQKNVKLWYHYTTSNFQYLILLPLAFTLSRNMHTLSSLTLEDLRLYCNNHLVITVVEIILATILLTFYFLRRPRPVYLIDLACYKPDSSWELTHDKFTDMMRAQGTFSEENLEFQRKMVERSGQGPITYIPPTIMQNPPDVSMASARKEAEIVMFGAIDELLNKTGVKVREIGIVITNCSLFCPTPSLSSMVVNRYKMRSNILNFNLGGMGCSAGAICVDLAKRLLQENKNTYALVVVMESLTMYTGNNRSMVLANALFRAGGVAFLLSNRRSDHSRAKYQLLHTVRTHIGANDQAYRTAIQEEDEEGNLGVYLDKNLISVAGQCMKVNITALIPLILPVSEQLLSLLNLVGRKLFNMNIKPYTPDFTFVVEHFCIHTGGRGVLDEVKRNLCVSEWHMEPSRMALYFYGNTSSSSIFYVMAYTEAMGRVKKGDRLWQIAFGSGFKGCSVVWRALRNVDAVKDRNVFIEDIPKYKVLGSHED